MKNTTYAVLTRDWTYTDMAGEKITWQKGRRFRLDNRTIYWNQNGNLVLAHWYGYGNAEIIDKKYFEKNR